METLCLGDNYRKRWARIKEFSFDKVEVVLDKTSCNPKSYNPGGCNFTKL